LRPTASLLFSEQIALHARQAPSDTDALIAALLTAPLPARETATSET
jgi:hypothetical protein